MLLEASFLLTQNKIDNAIQLLQQIPENSNQFLESQQMIARGSLKHPAMTCNSNLFKINKFI